MKNIVWETYPELGEQMTQRGYTPNKNTPSRTENTIFQKGYVYVWQCVHDREISWAVANIVGGFFENHKYFVDINQAVGYAETLV